MATETVTDAPEAPAPPPKKSSALALVAELVILTCFAVGAGGLFGMMVLANPEQAGQKAEPAAAHAKKAARPPETIIVRPLPAIVTNLASPQKTWVRMEAAVVVGDAAA